MLALKQILVFAFSVLFVSTSAQEFNDTIFWQQENSIDTLLAHADFPKAIIAQEKQIAYLISANRYDSLKRYTYNLGYAYIQVYGPEKAITRTVKHTDFIEQNTRNKSIHLSALSDLSWIYYESGKDSLCLLNDLRYLEICESFEEATPLEKSNAHYTLGFDYQMFIGNAKKAIYHFKEALLPVEKDSLLFKKQMMNCLNALGAGYFRNGENQKSQDFLNRALSFSVLLNDTSVKLSHQANIYGNLALCYEDEGNLVKSKSNLYKGIEIRKNLLKTNLATYDKTTQQRLLISNYHNLAALNLTIGDIAKAEKISKYVQKLRNEWLVPDHPDHNKSFEAFGSIQYALCEFDEAQINYEKYLAGNIADYGYNSYYTATGYQRIAKICYEKGDYIGVIKNCTETINIGKIITDELSGQELAKGYTLRSHAYRALKNYDLAEKDLHEAHKIYRNSLPEISPVIGNIYTELAKLKNDQNSSDSAQYYINLALNCFTQKHNEQTALYHDKLSQFTQSIADAYLTQANILLNENANISAQKKALEFLEKAIVYINTTKNLYVDETALLSFYDNHQAVFDATENLLYKIYMQTDDETYLDRILEIEEDNKAILLRQQLNRFTSLRVANVPDSVISRERLLQKEMTGAINKLENGRDIIDIEGEYDEIISLIKEKYPEYYNLRYNETKIDLNTIQQNLIKPKQNIIQYLVTDTAIFAFVINQKNTKLLKLNHIDLSNQIRDLNRSISTINSADFYTKATELYAAIFAPLEPFLDGDEIFIIPDMDLFNVNFETLVKPSNKHNPDYLIYHYTISYLNSATTAYQYHHLKRKNSNGLLALAPGFSDDLKSNYVSHLRDSTLLDIDYLKRIQQPFAVQAATEAAGIFSGQYLISNDATEQNFKTEASKYNIIHFGTHTEINNISPLLSRLVLSKSDALNTDEEDDGYLHVYEIYNTPLRAELAVLTACETGIGKQSSSEGMQSLANGFAYAGCPSIVMSLWQIDEKTSAIITRDFYKNLSSGMQKNKALRQAKLSFLKNNRNELAAPYYWSGIVLLGDVNALENTKGTALIWIVLLPLAIIVAFILFILANRKRKKRSMSN